MSADVQAMSPALQMALLFVPSVSAALAFTALLLNVMQIRRQQRLTRLNLVNGCIDTFLKDSDMQAAFYAIEYDQLKYGPSFHGSDMEKRLDKLLRHFSSLATAWKLGLVTNKDVRAVTYYLRRIVDNREVQMYLSFLDGWVKRNSVSMHPYETLRELQARLGRTSDNRS